jgi:signal transduction histidine kinase/CHASE2 domain-containing sensor protein
MMWHWATLPRELATATVAVAVVGGLTLLGWLPALERPVSDLLLELPHPGGVVDSPLAAVLIDDRSVEEIGPLPWPRARLAELVERVRSHGARAVVIDIVLSEPGDESDDRALERAISSGPTALAAVLRPDRGWLLPLERFGGALRAAHAHAEVAGDGVVRSVSSTKQEAGIALEALAIAAARMAGWRGAVVPGELIRPDFRQPPDEIPSIGAWDVITGTVAPQRIVGRVVLIGLSASGSGDQFVVPVGFRRRPSPGVLVHAAIASSILHGGVLRAPTAWNTLAALLLLSTAVQLMRSRSGRLSSRHLLLLAALVMAGAVVSLWVGGLQIPVVTMVTTVGLSALLREVVESRDAQRETNAILRALIERQNATSASPLPSGVGGRLQLVRTLQDQLARDRDLRRTLLDGLHEGVLMWDGRGIPLLSNAALEELWGPPPTLAEVAAAAARHAEEWSEPKRLDLERHGRHLELAVWPIEDGRLGLLRDVTAQNELERRRREMQRLVSHELKTPLSSIAGFGSMLESYQMSPEELRRVAGLIRGEAERLGEMVRTFLDLERLGSGQWEAEAHRLDLAELVRGRCQMLAQAAAERDQRIHISADGPSPVTGAPELVERLIDNLVGNALKYSPEGSTVEIGVATVEDRVVLSVTDHGSGIPDEALPRLFERFYRVPGTTATGSGLGLAVVREVADWHGATVEVVSQRGSGSTFTVRFPPTSEGGEVHAGEGPGR